MKTFSAASLFLTVFFSIFSLLCFREVNAQNCQPPLKQVVLYDQSGNFYVYWKPVTIPITINYKVTLKCTNLPPCFITVMVNNSNVLRMNGGYLGVKIPALPGVNSTLVASIFKPDCDEAFTPIFMEALDIITDDLSIANATCDGDTCEIFFSKWKKLKELTDYANSLCSGAVASSPAATITCVDAPIDIKLRKTASGNWQMKTLDSVECNTCYLFNFEVTCADGTINYVQDSICFNYTGIPCKLSTEDFSSEGELKVFPNPASEKATLEFYLTGKSLVTVTVRNALGQVIPEGNITHLSEAGKNQIVIATTQLSSGIYFVTLNTGNLTLSAKFIK